MKKLSLMLVTVLFGLTGFAKSKEASFDLSKDYKDFVNIGTKELFVDYQAPEKNKPTVVLLNGLTYTTRQWAAMTLQLKLKGYGVLRYDMDGMGQTLIKYGPKNGPYPYQNQVEDLYLLLKKLEVKKPYNLVGLSYGGGIGAGFAFKYPKLVNKIVLMAPYTQPLKDQDTWIKGQIAVTRLQFPLNPASDDELYDFFLRQISFATYPMVEPIVLEHPYKLEAVFRMTQGIRHFDVSASAHLFPKNSVYLVMAQQDQYIPAEVLENFWNQIPDESKVEKIYVPWSEHKIPEARPVMAAEIITHIFDKK